MAQVWTKPRSSTAAPASRAAAGLAVPPPAARPAQSRPRLSVHGFLLTVITAAALTSSTPPPPLKVSAVNAHRYIGKWAQVTGKVVRVHFAPHKSGAPVFLNLVKPCPDCPLEVVVFDYAANHMRPAPTELTGRTITVSSYIQAAAGAAAQMVPDRAAALPVLPE